MTSTAIGLLRALLARAPADSHRILLSSWCSTDWQSLTFVGERHQDGFVVRGNDALALATRWTKDIADAELPMGPGRFVADITVPTDLRLLDDGSVLIDVEALTLCE